MWVDTQLHPEPHNTQNVVCLNRYTSQTRGVEWMGRRQALIFMLAAGRQRVGVKVPWDRRLKTKKGVHSLMPSLARRNLPHPSKTKASNYHPHTGDETNKDCREGRSPNWSAPTTYHEHLGSLPNRPKKEQGLSSAAHQTCSSDKNTPREEKLVQAECTPLGTRYFTSQKPKPTRLNYETQAHASRKSN